MNEQTQNGERMESLSTQEMYEKLALERCDQQVDWYDKAMIRPGWAHSRSQGLAILFLGG